MLIGQQCVDFDSDNRQQNEFELPTENNKHPMNGGGRGGLRILLFSEVTLFEYNVSTILSPYIIVALEQTNLLGFILGVKVSTNTLRVVKLFFEGSIGGNCDKIVQFLVQFTFIILNVFLRPFHKIIFIQVWFERFHSVQKSVTL